MADFVLVVAGGSGLRMGVSVPKQMISVGGKPILAHTVQAFLEFSPELRVVTVLHPSILEEWKKIVKEHFTPEQARRILFAEGGVERVNSVHRGLQAIFKLVQSEGDHDPFVAIHDGVRPFVTKRMLKAAFAMAAEKGNAVAAVPVKSSLRIVHEDGSSSAIDRSKYFHVQTPQIFRLREILSCYENRPHDHFTDDASLAENFGVKIHLCEGNYDNIKITTPEDVEVAKVRLTENKN